MEARAVVALDRPESNVLVPVGVIEEVHAPSRAKAIRSEGGALLTTG